MPRPTNSRHFDVMSDYLERRDKMRKERDNGRVKYKKGSFPTKIFESLEHRVKDFHRLMVNEHGKKELKTNLDLYSTLITRYAIMYSRIFCSGIETSKIAVLIARLLDELDE